MSGLLPDLTPDHDWRMRVEAKIDQQAVDLRALVKAFLGDLDTPGGALGRINVLEAKVAQLEVHRSSMVARIWQFSQLPIGAAFGAFASALAEHWHK